MKIKFFTILIILISNIGYSQFDYPQELSFNKKLVSATYKDQNGNQKQSKISTLDGNFKFSIIKAAEQKNSPRSNHVLQGLYWLSACQGANWQLTWFTLYF